MSIEADFRAWLKANEAIAAVVGIHVYPVELPQKMDLKNPDLWRAITIPVAAETHAYDQAGNDGFDSITFSVKCHSFANLEELAYDNAVALSDVVKGQAKGTLTLGGGTYVYNVFATCEGRQDEQQFYYYEGKKGAGIQTITLTIQFTW